MAHTEDRTRRLIVGTATGVCQVMSTADGQAEIIAHVTPLPHAVARLAVCQTQPHIVYLAAYEGGMWRSDDGGGTWRQLQAYPVEQAHSVVVDPHNPAIVYVGSEPAAIFHSRDGGETWRECEGFRAVPESTGWHFFAPRQAHVRDLTMAADDPQRLYAGLEVGGVVRSTDGGATWQQLHAPTPTSTASALPRRKHRRFTRRPHANPGVAMTAVIPGRPLAMACRIGTSADCRGSRYARPGARLVQYELPTPDRPPRPLDGRWSQLAATRLARTA